MIFSLIQDFAAALDAMPSQHPRQRILALLDEAIRRDVHFIDRHPTTLFQCLWNSCWWYDCPEAERHFDPPADDLGGNETYSHESGPKLFQLLECWRVMKEKATPGVSWIRSLRPPPEHLGTALRAVCVGHEGEIISVAFFPDSRRIVTAAFDNTARLWHADSGREIRCLSVLEGAVRTGDRPCLSLIAWSADCRRMVCALDSDNSVWLLDGESGRVLQRLCGHEGRIHALAISSDGRWIASGSGVRKTSWNYVDGIIQGYSDLTLRVWDAETGQELHCLRGHESSINCVTFSPDGLRIASGSEDMTVRMWGTREGVEIACLRGHKNRVSSVAFSADGLRLCSGSWDGSVRVWHVESAREVMCLPGGRCAALSPDGRGIACAASDEHSSDENSVQIWAVDTGKEIQRLHGHTGRVVSVSYSPNGEQIVSGSYDMTARVWAAEAASRPRRVHDHKGFTGVVFCPDGANVASVSRDGTVAVWQTTSGSQLYSLRDTRANVVVFSPDGRWIVSGCTDATVRVWNVATGDELHCLREQGGIIDMLRFSADGSRLAVFSFTERIDQKVRVWDTRTWAQVCSLSGHEDWVRCAAFSADGQLVALGSEYAKTVRIWNVETCRELLCLYGHEDAIVALAFSPDARQLVTGSRDKTMRIWDIETGKMLWIERHESAMDVAFSPSGKFLVSVSNHVIVWDTERRTRWDILTGQGDAAALAIAAECDYPALTFSGFEAQIASPYTAGVVAAWFPIAKTLFPRRDNRAVHPAGRIWAWATDDHLYLYALEGDC
jgi:WD40 repeat protein